jgi:hypothetical protein
MQNVMYMVQCTANLLKAHLLEIASACRPLQPASIICWLHHLGWAENKNKLQQTNLLTSKQTNKKKHSTSAS